MKAAAVCAALTLAALAAQAQPTRPPFLYLEDIDSAGDALAPRRSGPLPPGAPSSQTPQELAARSEATVRGLYAAWARGDMPAMLARLAAEVRWREATGGPYAGTYVGPAAVQAQVFGRIAPQWRDFAVQPQQFIASGQRVVVTGLYSGRHAASGQPLHAPFAHVWTVVEGRVLAFEQHTDTALWQRAMGAQVSSATTAISPPDSK